MINLFCQKLEIQMLIKIVSLLLMISKQLTLILLKIWEKHMKVMKANELNYIKSKIINFLITNYVYIKKIKNNYYIKLIKNQNIFEH